MATEPPQRRTSLWSLIIVCALLAGAVILGQSENAATAPLPKRLPPIMAEGWLNAPAAPDVEGKVVVVDAWATWCGPCIRSLPSMATMHSDYGDRVVFIGLTAEPESDRDAIEGVINRVDGFNWPVGYGAWPTLEALGVEAYPTLLLFDASGNGVWSGHSVPELKRQLERLL